MKLHTLIFFVTSRCNARCQTCFYWRDLNQPGDLTYEEIERLSETMPPFEELWSPGASRSCARAWTRSYGCSIAATPSAP